MEPSGSLWVLISQRGAFKVREEILVEKVEQRRDLEDVSRGDPNSVQDLDEVCFPIGWVQVADEVWLSELGVGVVEQYASHPISHFGPTNEP